MISLYDYIFEAQNYSTFLIKTSDECIEYLNRKINNNTTIRDALSISPSKGLSDEMIIELYKYVEDNNFPAPIVGCYNNTKYNIAFRRWFTPNQQKKIIVDNISFDLCFDFESKYFKGYHNTSLKEDARYVPSAQDFETIICFGYNKLFSDIDDDENIKLLGLNEAKGHDINNYYYMNIESVNNMCYKLNDIVKPNKNITFNKLKCKGDIILPSWVESYKNKNNVSKIPKTDIISSNENFRISLKKYGGAQLMSAKIDEAKSTILSACNSLTDKETQHKVLTLLYNLLKINTESDTQQEKDTLFAEFGPEDLKGKTVEQMKKEDPDFARRYNECKERGKSFEAAFNAILKDYPEYKTEFFIEAITGTSKFSDTKCIPNYVFVWDDVHKNNNQIYNIQDYCKEVINNSKVVVDFKSWPTSNKSSQTLKIITK